MESWLCRSEHLGPHVWLGCPLLTVWLPAVMWALVVKFHMDSWALLSDLQI